MGRSDTADGVRKNQPTCRLNVTIPADPAEISGLVDRVSRELEERHWRDDDVMAVQLALTEAVANAIRHGCGGDINQRVECSVGCGAYDEVLLIVRDSGSGFDPNGVPDPLDPSNTFKPSGRGIFLMRVLMDHVAFVNGGREVRMRKRGRR
jgi:serine/threonine-protein kinase RsbW